MTESPINSTTHPLNEKVMKGTLIWMFWRKELKIRNYTPLFRVVDIYKTDKNIRSEVRYYFERSENKKIFMVNISKNNGIYFTVAKGKDVYESPVCFSVGQFEEEFRRYFRRIGPILPKGVGLLPGNNY